ncbi:multicopper oxidase family protein [Kitasatospora cinereorecta]|uniref:Multicopper oxidase domain-containing protein n=1 Tax=Kitasatospora cinereorecta TaxID=285560 RepID=A0ABW0V430_9ACTN
MNRRNFLSLAALSGVAAACGSRSGERLEPPPGAVMSTPLFVPPLLAPPLDGDGARHFELAMQTGRTVILPGQQTPTWGFNGAFLGPTLRAGRGDVIRMTVRNGLPEASTVHWHGIRVPAAMDGGPHQLIQPGAVWNPAWTLDQPATTAWYHPHPHGTTAQHVYRGLAGLFIVDDAEDHGLPAAYGVDDVPLVLQDKEFAADGSFSGDPLRGIYGILGDHMLVNGVWNPRFDVTTQRVRLRILNGAQARMFNLTFADRRRFHVVGNDGGLLGAPVEVDQLVLTPGERAEVVVGFAPGDDVVLRTLDNGVDLAKGDFDLVRFVAATGLKPSPALPAHPATLPAIVPPAGARLRTFALGGRDSINGRPMDMDRIDEVVPAGAVEIWEVDGSGFAHNFHIHEVAFQVLDVNGAAPPAHASGHKDTVYVPVRSKVRLAVQFGRDTDPSSPYMYHCHILRHEDAGMMGQFVIVEPGTESQVPHTLSGRPGQPTPHH